MKRAEALAVRSIGRSRKWLRSEGVLAGAARIVAAHGGLIWGITIRNLQRRLTAPPPFVFDGKVYTQVRSSYNHAWLNERAVEIPIIRQLLNKAAGPRILEVGNVLSHYFPVFHDIVDKYEQAAGVLNLDVCEFNPPKPYDLIISISTLEHVGWDEVPREPMKSVDAIRKLHKMLMPGGTLAVTLPLGHNAILDDYLLAEGGLFQRQLYLQRTSRDNRWAQVSRQEVDRPKYDSPFLWGNVVVVGISVAPE